MAETAATRIPSVRPEPCPSLCDFTVPSPVLLWPRSAARVRQHPRPVRTTDDWASRSASGGLHGPRGAPSRHDGKRNGCTSATCGCIYLSGSSSLHRQSELLVCLVQSDKRRKDLRVMIPEGGSSYHRPPTAAYQGHSSNPHHRGDVLQTPRDAMRSPERHRHPGDPGSPRG